jgi:tyrosine-protein kinase Etk/Wzc
MNNPQQQIIKTSSSNENTFHYLAFFSRLIKYWYLFPISLAAMLFVALYYIRYSQSMYEVNTTLLIKNDVSSGGNKRFNGIKDVTDIYNEYQNIGNEKVIIESYSSILKALKQLDWKVLYYEKSKYTVDEIYDQIPFCINIDSNHIQ